MKQFTGSILYYMSWVIKHSGGHNGNPLICIIHIHYIVVLFHDMFSKVQKSYLKYFFMTLNLTNHI